MRNFVSESNLIKASALAAVVTIMSAGRIVQAGKSPGFFVAAMFLLMTFIAGAVTAWGRCADMPGIVTNRTLFLRGLTVAAILSLLALPVYIFWLDPFFRHALAGARNTSLLELSYPAATSGRIALVLWSAGFQAMFFVAAPVSLFARLTNRRSVTIALCVALRAYLASRQVAINGIATGGAFFVLLAVTTTIVQCFVFMRYGLAPTMLLAAGLDAHVFVSQGFAP